MQLLEFGSLSSAESLPFIDTVAAVALNTALAMMSLALEGCSALGHWARKHLTSVQQSVVAGVALLTLTVPTAAHGGSLLTHPALHEPAPGGRPE